MPASVLLYRRPRRREKMLLLMLLKMYVNSILLENPNRGFRGVKDEELKVKNFGFHLEKYQLKIVTQRLNVSVWVAMPQNAKPLAARVMPTVPEIRSDDRAIKASSRCCNRRKRMARGTIEKLAIKKPKKKYLEREVSIGSL